MAKALEELRIQLARVMGMAHEGTATGGAVDRLLDTNGLARFTEDDALLGSLLYIREDFGGMGAAPEGEAREVVEYTVATHEVFPEFDFSAAVGVGDLYELYLAPLSLEEWDEAINAAIREAWPEIWEPLIAEGAVAGPADAVNLVGDSAEAEEIAGVWLRDTAISDRWFHVPRAGWRFDRNDANKVLYLATEVANGTEYRVLIKARYAELAAGEETELDEGYLLAAAQGYANGSLAGRTGGQADESRFLQLMNHWQEVARARKAAVGTELAVAVGAPSPEPVKGKK